MTEVESTGGRHDRRLHRREWLMIYLPLILGGAAAAALVAAIAVPGLTPSRLGRDPASVWSDAAAVLVAIEVGLLGLILLVALVASSALAFWLYREARPVLKRGHDLTATVNQRVDGAAQSLVDSFIRAHWLDSRVRGVLKFRWRRDV